MDEYEVKFTIRKMSRTDRDYLISRIEEAIHLCGGKLSEPIVITKVENE